jgi:hypothetical protein
MQNSERPLKRHAGAPHPVATRYADLRSLRASADLSVLAGPGGVTRWPFAARDDVLVADQKIALFLLTSQQQENKAHYRSPYSPHGGEKVARSAG